MKNSEFLCLLIIIITISQTLQTKAHPPPKHHAHQPRKPSPSLKRKLQQINSLFTQSEPKAHRKLADPFTDLVYTGHKILESAIYSDTKYQNISAGKIGMVLPRDAPTMVVNELPLQRFYLNGRNSGGAAAPHYTGLQMNQRVLESVARQKYNSNGFV